MFLRHCAYVIHVEQITWTQVHDHVAAAYAGGRVLGTLHHSFDEHATSL